jgi:signal transduction histidine kinase
LSRRQLALLAIGSALGIVAEPVASGGAAFTALDFIVGMSLIAASVFVWGQGEGARITAGLFYITGFAWFVGNLASWFAFLHRGPLVHLILTYPGGRARGRFDATLVALGYLLACVYPLDRSDRAVLAFGALLGCAAIRSAVRATGTDARLRMFAAGAGVAYGSVLSLVVGLRLAGTGAESARLAVYDSTVGLIGVSLLVALLRERFSQAAVTGLVVNLGGAEDAGTLRDRLARALGDPSLVVAYWLPERQQYVDEAGRTLRLSEPHPGRAVTPVFDGERPLAAIVHDDAVLTDRALAKSVAAAARVALVNVRLQTEVQARVAEVEASRRRIVEAADAVRRRIERELREGPERRLARATQMLEDSPRLRQHLGDALGDARLALREFARGVHPAVLNHGLGPALHELAIGSELPVAVNAPDDRLPPAIEAAAYFVCAEALTNIAKHARASTVKLTVATEGARLLVEITDDGVGGADMRGGSGLRGLADRVEGLGGVLAIDSSSGSGTRISARLPLTEPAATD